MSSFTPLDPEPGWYLDVPELDITPTEPIKDYLDRAIGTHMRKMELAMIKFMAEKEITWREFQDRYQVCTQDTTDLENLRIEFKGWIQKK